MSFSKTATIFDIVRNSFVDGPGIRTAVFFKGCNLNCRWCHNPEGIKREKQLMFYKNKCTSCGECKKVCKNPDSCILCGECAEGCPHDAKKLCGREYPVFEILETLKKDIPYFKNSNGGATFSGGECMLYADFLRELLIKCHENKINTAVDTAGNVPFESFKKVLPYTDLFLYDIKCISPEKHREFTGVDNALILENYKKLITLRANIWVRTPIVCEFNDNEKEILKIKALITEYPPQKIELLPYHKMGEGKRSALGLKEDFISEPPDNINELRKLLL